MAWFKVDDRLHSHEKVIEAVTSSVGRESMGLWTVAGSWAGDNQTDGRVPLLVVKRLGFAKRHAEKLVAVGLWERADEGAYQFHDWLDFQPSRDDGDAKSQKKSEAGRLGGIASGRSRREAAASKHHEAPAGQATKPDPTRPDPTRTEPVSTTSAAHDPVSQDHTGSAGVCEGVSDPPRRRPRTHAGSPEPKVSVLVWEAYSAEYQRRYGSAPVSNAKVRGQLAQFVARVPAAEAPDVARTYVWSNHSRYVAACHPVGMLLQDAEALTTQLRTGRSVTRHSAVQLDRRAGRGEEYEQVIAELEAEREVAHG